MKYVLLLISMLPWPLKRLVYRILLGAQIAPGAHIGFGSWIVTRELKLGDRAVIGPFVFANCHTLVLDNDARIERFSHVSVARLELGKFAKIGKKVEITGGHSSNECSVLVGEYSWIFQETFINAVSPVIIGRNVGIGGRSLIFTHGYWLSRFKGFPYSKGGVTIGDNVWLPWDCFVMAGVTIGENVVVGARSVINRDVPSGCLIAGIPAKVIREQSWQPPTTKALMEMLIEWIEEFAAMYSFRVSVEDSSTTSIKVAMNRMHVVAGCIGDDIEVRLSEDGVGRLSFWLVEGEMIEREGASGQVDAFIEFGRRYGFRLQSES